MKTSILKLDIDTDSFNDFFSEFIERHSQIKYTITFKINEVKVFKTRRGYHIEFILNKKILPYEVIFYQLLFLSDPNREVFNLRRLRFKNHHIDEWNILYGGSYDKEKKKFIWRKTAQKEQDKLTMFLIKQMEEIENDWWKSNKKKSQWIMGWN